MTVYFLIDGQPVPFLKAATFRRQAMLICAQGRLHEKGIETRAGWTKGLFGRRFVLRVPSYQMAEARLLLFGGNK